MFRILIIISLFFTFTNQLIAQNRDSTRSYFKLLDTAVKINGHFINYKPISKSRLIKENMDEYYMTLFYDNISIDTCTLLEIIDNNKQLDTTPWNDQEIKKYGLVTENYISIGYLIKKLNLINTDEISFYNSLISKIIDPNICNKGIYRISRPMYNLSKNIALIQYEKYNCRTDVITTIKAFKYSENSWNYLGIVLDLRRSGLW